MSNVYFPTLIYIDTVVALPIVPYWKDKRDKKEEQNPRKDGGGHVWALDVLKAPQSQTFIGLSFFFSCTN